MRISGPTSVNVSDAQLETTTTTDATDVPCLTWLLPSLLVVQLTPRLVLTGNGALRDQPSALHNHLGWIYAELIREQIATGELHSLMNCVSSELAQQGVYSLSEARHRIPEELKRALQVAALAAERLFHQQHPNYFESTLVNYGNFKPSLIPPTSDARTAPELYAELRRSPTLNEELNSSLLGPWIRAESLNELTVQYNLPSNDALRELADFDTQCHLHHWPHEHPLTNEATEKWRAQHSANARRKLRRAQSLQLMARQRKQLGAQRVPNQRAPNQRAAPARHTSLSGRIQATDDAAEQAIRTGVATATLNRDIRVAVHSTVRIIDAWSSLYSKAAELRPLMSTFQLETHRTYVQGAGVEIIGAELNEPHSRMLVNPYRFEDSGQAERQMLRVLLSIALGYPARQGDRDAQRWSVATQLALRPQLDLMYPYDAHPEEPLSPELSRLETPERIYDALPERTTNPFSRAGDVFGPQSNAECAEQDEAVLEALRKGLLTIDPDGLMFSGATLRELKARAEPPPPWEFSLSTQLSRWGVRAQAQRSYARASRRQRDPFQPRRGTYIPPGQGGDLIVVADISGSVQDEHANRAMGAVMSLCRAHGVTRLRLLTTDARTTDHGWIRPDRLSSGVRASGGGGTQLSDALRHIDSLSDIEPDVPVLIFTDGEFYETLNPNREHAFLLTPRARLLFRTDAPVFKLR